MELVLTWAPQRAQPSWQRLKGRQGQQDHFHELDSRQAVALLVVEVGVKQTVVLDVPRPVGTQSDHTDVLEDTEEVAKEQVTLWARGHTQTSRPLRAGDPNHNMIFVAAL